MYLKEVILPSVVLLLRRSTQGLPPSPSFPSTQQEGLLLSPSFKNWQICENKKEERLWRGAVKTRASGEHLRRSWSSSVLSAAVSRPSGLVARKPSQGQG